ncbi:MAG: thioredoxin domain-containing protein [Elusimicrobiota bacterium]
MPNRLISEKSPYLLQHAHNPVDWRPWNEESFAAARARNKPIFLSIGYSTCHWCHVMERESFESLETARILNENFVPIKVDREERPDIDRIYMAAVQAIAGQGGWPLSVFLTPELMPFFGGTYFPPEPRWNMPAFNDVLAQISKAWSSNRPRMVAEAQRLADALRPSPKPAPAANALPDIAVGDSAAESYASSFDREHGGFSRAPKFPLPANQHFLFRLWARTKRADVLDMALSTLRQMSRGGIFDHLGGGFHRYSTDEAWRVPHFEKMLYDNAQLAVNFLEAFQITGDQDFAKTARAVLDYMLRDLESPHGGFFCAEDADSLPETHAPEKFEGAFYIWTKGEIKAAARQDADLFCAYYGVQDDGESVLHAGQSTREISARLGTDQAQAGEALDRARARLLAARARRPRPDRDEKILSSWTALAISAFAKGARVLGDDGYLLAAARAAEFIHANLWDGEKLFHRWAGGERAVMGTSDDYAFLAQALLDLFDADNNPRHLEWALRLCRDQKRLFWASPGGFYLTAAGSDPRLLFRVTDEADNVEPCASSISASNALRLSRLTSLPDLEKTAADILAAFSDRLKERPLSLPSMLSALELYASPPTQIVISGRFDDPRFQEMIRVMHRRFLPFASKIIISDLNAAEAARAMPESASFAPGPQALAYLCAGFSCQAPMSDVRGLEDALSRII